MIDAAGHVAGAYAPAVDLGPLGRVPVQAPALLLDGLGSGSDEQMRAEVGEMLDALVLLLQSAATQYGVRAEVDAYVLPLVTLVQQAVLGPAGRAKKTARKRATTAARRRRRSLSLLATGQDDDTAANGDGDGDGDGLPDVAAAIGSLDLLIGVDTALVHLAGAMGMPVWTMISKVPDWRWMLDRADTPWYPSMRLFRQKQTGDWGPVIEDVNAALADFTKSKKVRSESGST